MAGPFKKKEKDGNIMGKIYYVMGKSASGKDTIYKRLVKELPELGTVRMYTTRPIRDGETNAALMIPFTGRGVILRQMTGRSIWDPAVI